MRTEEGRPNTVPRFLRYSTLWRVEVVGESPCCCSRLVDSPDSAIICKEINRIPVSFRLALYSHYRHSWDRNLKDNEYSSPGSLLFRKGRWNVRLPFRLGRGRGGEGLWDCRWGRRWWGFDDGASTTATILHGGPTTFPSAGTVRRHHLDLVNLR